ncbi:MAG: hypothetical protein ACRDAX_07045 [Propionibacteriaceae bacterium]
MVDPLALLQHRVRTNGGAPLLTCYSLASGSRIELSARTVANWADKIFWALEDADVEPGDVVSHRLLASHPTSWGPLVWALGIWQRGATITFDPHQADITIDEPGSAADLHCSLHPLGLGSDVLAFPDLHAREPLANEALVGITWQDISIPQQTGRQLVVPQNDPWKTVIKGLLVPLANQSSVVLLDANPSSDQTEQIAQSEHCNLSNFHDDACPLD